MNEMDEMEYQWIAQFLGEEQQQFMAFMEERGEDEAAVERLLDKLKTLGGMR